MNRQNDEGFFPYPEWFPPAANPPPKPFPSSTDVYTTATSSGLASAQRGPALEPASVTYSICAQATIWMSKVKEALEISITDDIPDVGGGGAAAAAGGGGGGGGASAEPAAKRAKTAGGY